MRGDVDSDVSSERAVFFILSLHFRPLRSDIGTATAMPSRRLRRISKSGGRRMPPPRSIKARRRRSGVHSFCRIDRIDARARRGRCRRRDHETRQASCQTLDRERRRSGKTCARGGVVVCGDGPRRRRRDHEPRERVRRRADRRDRTARLGVCGLGRPLEGESTERSSSSSSRSSDRARVQLRSADEGPFVVVVVVRFLWRVRAARYARIYRTPHAGRRQHALGLR